MSRTILRMVLGGALVLLTAACGQGSTAETIPADLQNQEASSSDAGNSEAQNSETGDKPVVTVSRNPT